MSPAEAAALVEEPDWIAMFKDLGGEDSAFQATLYQWRRWHWTPIEVDGVLKKNPADRVEGNIALALLGIMSPRTLTDRPPSLFEEQHDSHCWLLSKERAWRILGVEDGMLCLNSFGDEWQIDMSRAKWDDYVVKASAALERERGRVMP